MIRGFFIVNQNGTGYFLHFMLGEKFFLSWSQLCFWSLPFLMWTNQTKQAPYWLPVTWLYTERKFTCTSANMSMKFIFHLSLSFWINEPWATHKKRWNDKINSKIEEEKWWLSIPPSCEFILCSILLLASYFTTVTSYRSSLQLKFIFETSGSVSGRELHGTQLKHEYKSSELNCVHVSMSPSSGDAGGEGTDHQDIVQ